MLIFTVMNILDLKVLAQKLNLTEKQVLKASTLLDEGATIPFISRYRKEMTDGMDEVQLFDLQQLIEKQKEFELRKKYILNLIFN